MTACPQIRGGLPAALVEILLERFQTPSTKWADFNPTWVMWNYLRRCAENGLFDPDCLPAEPNPNDYFDKTSERSEMWDILHSWLENVDL
jgi:hypothetical protein